MSEQLAGGINVRYRKSCGMCKHRVVMRASSYCNKAFELDGNPILISGFSALYVARANVSSVEEFNKKYSVAPNMVCDEYFEPIRTRYTLD